MPYWTGRNGHFCESEEEIGLVGLENLFRYLIFWVNKPLRFKGFMAFGQIIY